MAHGDVIIPIDSAPSERPGWGARIAWWAEQLIPRIVGLIFLWAGVGKAHDPTRTQRVFAFDGVPQPLTEPLTYAVSVGEMILGLALVIGFAQRRAVMAAILVLFVYSVQLAYLIAANNPPKDCGCVMLLAKYASAKQAMVLGLVRNAVMAVGLEWVRLRIAGRAMSSAEGFEVPPKKEDGQPESAGRPSSCSQNQAGDLTG
ncbi:MAG TPA: DoxX family protein [Tepidisphaeraceae bacterium]|nr:DoxX family protein [Tepidisphaeraceae bacterium]